MLMTTQGLHQGDGPKLKDAPVRSNYQKVIANADRKLNKKPAEEVSVAKSRLDRWKVTGVVALSECHIKSCFARSPNQSEFVAFSAKASSRLLFMAFFASS